MWDSSSSHYYDAGSPPPPYRKGSRRAKISRQVGALRFYMAMCRGRLLKAPWIEDAIEMSALLVGHPRHFNNQGGDLHLSGTSYRFADFEQKAFPGRVGNALALIQAEKLGYRWFAHFEEAVPQHLRCQGRTPDFLADNGSETAALEGKCTTTKAEREFETHLHREHKDQCAEWVNVSCPLGLSEAITIGTRITIQEPATTWTIRQANTGPSTRRLYRAVTHNYRPWFTLSGNNRIWTSLALPPDRQSKGTAPRTHVMSFTWRGIRFVALRTPGRDRNTLHDGDSAIHIAFPERLLYQLLAIQSIDDPPTETIELISDIATDTTERLAPGFFNQAEDNNQADIDRTWVPSPDGILVFRGNPGIEEFTIEIVDDIFELAGRRAVFDG